MGDALRRIYLDPARPGSFGGVRALYREAKKELPRLTLSQTKKFLAGEEAYTLHAAARRRFPRNRILVREIDELWQADLSDLSGLRSQNDGYSYLLVCIDALSKYLWVVPLKDKRPSSVVSGFRQIFSTSGRSPAKLQTDKGTEFNNATVRAFLKEYYVHYFVTQNEDIKASLAERVQRTLKGKMWRFFTANKTHRYLDALPDLVRSYNDTVHSRTGFAPSRVDSRNQKKVYENLFGRRGEKPTQPRYRPGETVRLAVRKGPFSKGYTPNWTRELFTVGRAVPRRPHPVYRVTDLNEQPLTGSFYGQELQPATKPPDEVYSVERVLQVRRRGRQAPVEYLVRWAGYPPSFDSWVTEIRP